jgi:hypothetical protein
MGAGAVNNSFEQLWCKLTASNDWFSQLACYANFEDSVRQAEASGSLDSSAQGWLAVVCVVVALWILARAFTRAGQAIGDRAARKPPQRIEPKP